jgi:transposase-like protein
MTVVKDITNQVLVPKINKKENKGSSFFIGRLRIYTPEDTTENNVRPVNRIKQRHLDDSKIIDTPWKEIKDVY